jgi:hypothetical protein
VLSQLSALRFEENWKNILTTLAVLGFHTNLKIKNVFNLGVVVSFVE